MQVNDLIAILLTLPPNTEVLVNAWSSEEDYDRTSEIKVCTLGGSKKPQVIVCDEKTEYWTRKIEI